MISANQLRQFLLDSGIVPINQMIGDENYSLPAREWLTGPFADSLASVQNALGLYGYQAESNDCDDFSRLGAAVAQGLHNGTKAGRTSLAVGEFWYVSQQLGGGHAILIAIIREQGALVPVFIEPQRPIHVRNLTPEEIKSCSDIRF